MVGNFIENLLLGFWGSGGSVSVPTTVPCQSPTPKSKIMRVCLVCKTIFPTYQSRINVGKGKYCSKKCYDASLIGGKHSEEHKIKIGLGNKGRINSEETKEKIRSSLLGHLVSSETRIKIGNKNRGKKRTEETKIKIGLGSMGHKLSDEAKEKIGLSHRGKPLSEEHKKKMSLARIGKNTKEESHLWKGGKVKVICQQCGIDFETFPSRVKSGKGKYCSKKCTALAQIGSPGYWTGKKRGPLSEEWKNKISISGKGKTRPSPSAETRKKMSEARLGKPNLALRGRKFSEELRKKLSLAHIGKKLTPEQIKKTADALRGRKHPREFGEKISIAKRTKAGFACRERTSSVRERIKGSFEYKKWRQEIFIRDNFICQKCGNDTGDILQAHHKKPFVILMREANQNLPLFDLYTACMLYKPMWNTDNGITLCRPCHKKTETYGNSSANMEWRTK